MKFFKIIISVTFLFFLSPSMAQNNENSLIVSFQSHIFTDNGNLNGSFRAVNPGAEVLYERSFSELLSVSSGINYIFSSWFHSIGVTSEFKRISHEVFIPVLFDSRVNKKISVSYGIYSGWLVNAKELYRNNIDIRTWTDNTHNTDFSSASRFTADLFFGIEYSQPTNSRFAFAVAPFVKYKLKDNWNGEIRNRANFGIKFQGAVNF